MAQFEQAGGTNFIGIYEFQACSKYSSSRHEIRLNFVELPSYGKLYFFAQYVEYIPGSKQRVGYIHLRQIYFIVIHFNSVRLVYKADCFGWFNSTL